MYIHSLIRRCRSQQWSSFYVYVHVDWSKPQIHVTSSWIVRSTPARWQPLHIGLYADGHLCPSINRSSADLSSINQ